MGLFFREFIVPIQGIPHGVSGVGIVLFYLPKKFLHLGAVGVVLVGAALDLLLITPQLGIAGDVAFFYHAERTDDAQGHLSHLEQRGHSVETSLIDEVHEGGGKQVVLMVPKGYLIAPQLLGKVEHNLPPVPRTQETGRLAPQFGGVFERCGPDMQRHVELLAEMLQVLGRCLVGDIGHAHMEGLDAESRMLYLGPACEHLEEAQRILAAGQTNEDAVAVFKQAVGGEGLDKAFANTPFEVN